MLLHCAAPEVALAAPGAHSSRGRGRQRQACTLQQQRLALGAACCALFIYRRGSSEEDCHSNRINGVLAQASSLAAASLQQCGLMSVRRHHGLERCLQLIVPYVQGWVRVLGREYSVDALGIAAAHVMRASCWPAVKACVPSRFLHDHDPVTSLGAPPHARNLRIHRARAD